ncbi:hypothetical protein [Ensifer sp. LCM 4579]|uniref:hypothetical protein n=1 Tax=Ensifer sp. LCM 4579 TaxID=1848292 RepID=UPI001041CBAE|nr:hypothetical protein [Ensifer sp. LCM 4579]
MFHEANAIEAMAINIRFSEPVGSLLMKKIISELEHSTSRAGLIDKRPLQGFQVNLANPGEVKPVASGAMAFQKTSLERDREGQVQSILASQIEAQATHFTYQTWRYSKWTSELATVLEILLSALKIATQSVALGSIRLEYLDRFYFEGEPSEAVVNNLLRADSGWIAPHVFEAPDLWHSHTGKFVDVAEDRRKLLLVNADFQDLTGPDPHLHGRRSLQLMTAAEERFADQGYEVTSESVESFLSSTLNDLHGKAITVFKEVMNNDFRIQQGLPHD